MSPAACQRFRRLAASLEAAHKPRGAQFRVCGGLGPRVEGLGFRGLKVYVEFGVYGFRGVRFFRSIFAVWGSRVARVHSAVCASVAGICIVQV